jgi:hypothetical protein
MTRPVLIDRLEPRRLLSADTGLRGDYFGFAPDGTRWDRAVITEKLFAAGSEAVGALPTVSQVDANIDFDWNESSPVHEVPRDVFAIRWTGAVTANTTGTHTFRVGGVQGIRLYVDGELVADDWLATDPNNRSTDVVLTTGDAMDIRLEMRHLEGGADIDLRWTPPGQTEAVVPQTALSPWRPPITLDEGGLYVGSWQSLNADEPAITLATNRPIRIEQSRTRARGIHITNSVGDADLIVRDTLAVGLNPEVAGRSTGRFIYLLDPQRLVAEFNRLDGTSGIFAQDADNLALSIAGNEVRNIDGRHSDGNGGYETFNEFAGDRGFDKRQFFQIDHVTAPGGLIAWNRVLNEPGRSRVEDNINIYHSGGTAENPLIIRDNLIDGAYTVDPESFGDGWEYSGGGILVGDTPQGETAGQGQHVVVASNRVINVMNHGIAIAGGRNQKVIGNVVVSDGIVPGLGLSRQTDDVGVYVWNSYGTEPFGNNIAAGNAIGYQRGDLQGQPLRNDIWLPDAAAGSDGNAALPTPDGAAEQRQARIWGNEATAAGIQPGPRSVDRRTVATPLQAETALGFSAAEIGPLTTTLASGGIIALGDVDFGNAPLDWMAEARVRGGGTVELRINGARGPLLASFAAEDTWSQVAAATGQISGSQALYLINRGGEVELDSITLK